MTTSTFDVGGLLSVLGERGIEKQLRRTAGVGRVSVNPVSGSTSVDDDQNTSLVKSRPQSNKQCGFHNGQRRRLIVMD